MNYKRLINAWHIKATEEDYFSKFVFEYLAFIAHLKTQLYHDAKQDRQAIQKLKQDVNIKNDYFEEIKSNEKLKNNWETIIEELNKIPLGDASRDLDNTQEIKWWNCSHDELNQQTPQEAVKRKGVIRSIDDWENMVEFWYAIRNNLFHGAKDPEVKRDKFAVEYGFKTLSELMNILLK
ncbi:MAG: hypothetical protein WC307_00550 [Candidatus Nanoarchaeia archaeon]|jgi:predicted S18 family serine protease